jgi:hypothetical protein
MMDRDGAIPPMPPPMPNPPMPNPPMIDPEPDAETVDPDLDLPPPPMVNDAAMETPFPANAADDDDE